MWNSQKIHSKLPFFRIFPISSIFAILCISWQYSWCFPCIFQHFTSKIWIFPGAVRILSLSVKFSYLVILVSNYYFYNFFVTDRCNFHNLQFYKHEFHHRGKNFILINVIFTFTIFINGYFTIAVRISYWSI